MSNVILGLQTARKARACAREDYIEAQRAEPRCHGYLRANYFLIRRRVGSDVPEIRRPDPGCSRTLSR